MRLMYDRPLDSYEDPEVRRAEMWDRLEDCVLSNDSKAMPLQDGRLVLAARVLGYAGFAPKAKQGAHHHLLTIVGDSLRGYEVTVDYFDYDGKDFAERDKVKVEPGKPVICDDELVNALYTVINDASQYSWFELGEAEIVARQLEPLFVADR